jgi:hypothetical protein
MVTPRSAAVKRGDTCGGQVVMSLYVKSWLIYTNYIDFLEKKDILGAEF